MRGAARPGRPNGPGVAVAASLWLEDTTDASTGSCGEAGRAPAAPGRISTGSAGSTTERAGSARAPRLFAPLTIFS
jgi:hypothetical protein